MKIVGTKAELIFKRFIKFNIKEVDFVKSVNLEDYLKWFVLKGWIGIYGVKYFNQNLLLNQWLKLFSKIMT